MTGNEEVCMSPLRLTGQCNKCPKLESCALPEAIKVKCGEKSETEIPTCRRVVKNGTEENKDG